MGFQLANCLARDASLGKLCRSKRSESTGEPCGVDESGEIVGPSRIL